MITVAMIVNASCHYYSCPEARSVFLPSCSHPLTQFHEPDQEDFCPTPPQFFIGDNATSGPLDSFNTFVAELLLREADDDDPSVFFRENQAGIVVSRRDPPYSVCRCVDGDRDNTCDYINPLNDIHGDIDNPPIYLQVSDPCANCIRTNLNGTITARDECIGVCNSVNQSICFNHFDGLYNVDGGSADSLTVLSQPSMSAERRCGGKYEVGVVTPNQERPVAVTVWYNNQVSY